MERALFLQIFTRSSEALADAQPAGGAGPGENAGIIDIGDGWACAFKIESHNHPSFIEPFQGAATGVGGILRDIFTMGARPVAVMDSLRFGPIDGDVGRAPRPPERQHRERSTGRGSQESLRARRRSQRNRFLRQLLRRAQPGRRDQVRALLLRQSPGECFCSGPGPARQIFYAKASGEGNPVIYVGSKTGRDGIHGATMASEEFSEASEAKRPNVQVGDPFLEKLLLEACLEAMQTGAIVGIQDMGAAGLTCSTCEMGARGSVGTRNRTRPRSAARNRHDSLRDHAERIAGAHAAGGAKRPRAGSLRVFEKWGLDAVEVGRVTSDGKMRVLHHGEVVAEIPNQALTDDAPVYKRPLERWEPPVPREMPEHIQLGGAFAT